MGHKYNIDKKSKFSRRKGFTIVELIVVIVILGIVTAIAVPTYYGVTESSNKKTFETNHNIIVSGINMYISAHNGAYPSKAGDLKNCKYIAFDDSDDFIADDANSKVCEFFRDEPKGATYILTFTENGFELVSNYKDNELRFERYK